MNTAVDHFSYSNQRRDPPHNFDAEQALLGAIMINNQAYYRVSEFLRPEHFTVEAHAQIFAACRTLIESGTVANPLTLKNRFDQEEGLLEIGGGQYLARLAGSATTVINARDYGNIIFDLHLRRQLINIGEDAVNDAFDHDPESSAQKAIERMDQRLTELMGGVMTSSLQQIGGAARRSLEQAEAARKNGTGITGLPTGFVDLDRWTGGLQSGELIIVAARPGMGKTAWAVSAALAMARAGIPVSFFSLEMSEVQIARRLQAIMSGVPLVPIRTGRLTDADLELLAIATRELDSLPLFINDVSNQTPAAIRARARAIKRRHGKGVTIVDHIQIMSGGEARYGNRTTEITDITKGLKAAAKELDGPVIALSQLSRAVESRDDKRPQLSDLRESGSIEQDADIVMFLYRQEYYHRQAEPDRSSHAGKAKHVEWEADLAEIKGLAEGNIAKMRDGGPTRIEYQFNGELVSFNNLEKRRDEE